MADEPLVNPEEQVLFKGSPSLATEAGPLTVGTILFIGGLVGGFWFSPYVFILSVIAAIYVLYHVIVIKSRVYHVTSQRIKNTRGILTKRTDELELYRVKDATLVEPFFLRMMGLGNIEITTTDISTPHILFEGIHDAAQLREALRKSIEACRLRKGVRITELE